MKFASFSSASALRASSTRPVDEPPGSFLAFLTSLATRDRALLTDMRAALHTRARPMGARRAGYGRGRLCMTAATDGGFVSSLNLRGLGRSGKPSFREDIVQPHRLGPLPHSRVKLGEA